MLYISPIGWTGRVIVLEKQAALPVQDVVQGVALQLNLLRDRILVDEPGPGL